MRNVKLLLEYDGTDFIGWQRQETGRSVQGDVEAILERVLQEEKVNLIGAGRTDAGVHARGQTANFRTSSRLPLEQIRGALLGLLPEDITLRGIEDVQEDFHARFMAKERTYSYLITRVPRALMRQTSWYVKYPLDEAAMNLAAAGIVGEHDFGSFCRTASEVEHHRCSVRVSEWTSSGEELRYTISADRFLHGMVRALVGTMVDIGRGYSTIVEFGEILSRKDRREAGPAAPARGLVLESVLYGKENKKESE